jgi:hypothetical protein
LLVCHGVTLMFFAWRGRSPRHRLRIWLSCGILRFPGAEVPAVVQTGMALAAQPFDPKRPGIILVMAFDLGQFATRLAPIRSADLPEEDGVLQRLSRQIPQKVLVAVLGLTRSATAALGRHRARLRTRSAATVVGHKWLRTVLAEPGVHANFVLPPTISVSQNRQVFRF